MFARVSTYTSGPESVTEPSEEIAQRVLDLPGCQGVYYLAGRDNGKALSITLWDSEQSLTASRDAANRIRSDASEAQHTAVADVEEYEIMMSRLQDQNPGRP